VPGQSSKPLSRPWKSMLVPMVMGALWICGAIGPAVAQNPTGAHVELWYGMRRVDGLDSAPPAAAAPVEPARPTLTVKKEVAAPLATPPPPPVPLPPRFASFVPPPSVQASRVREPVKIPITSVLPARANSAAPSVSIAPESRRADPAKRAGSGEGFLGMPPALLISMLIALILGPLLGALSCWLLLRRQSRHHAGPVRVDFSSPSIYGVPAPSASTVALQTLQPEAASCQAETPASRVVPRPGGLPARPAPAAEAFDPGPSFVAVMQQKEDALRRHEEGILQYLVEQNVELMEQIAYS
jgi:hypothetical protein